MAPAVSNWSGVSFRDHRDERCANGPVFGVYQGVLQGEYVLAVFEMSDVGVDAPCLERWMEALVGMHTDAGDAAAREAFEAISAARRSGRLRDAFPLTPRTTELVRGRRRGLCTRMRFLAQHANPWVLTRHLNGWMVGEGLSAAVGDGAGRMAAVYTGGHHAPSWARGELRLAAAGAAARHVRGAGDVPGVRSG